MPYFVWFGVLGLLLLYAAGITMLLAKQRGKVQLRRYHPLLGSGQPFLLSMPSGPMFLILAAHFPYWAG